MRKRRLLKTNDSDEALVNLTPLIDVVFVVLIMFILVAPLIEIDRIALASGRSSEEKAINAAKTSITKIYVHEDNRVRINELEVDVHELDDHLLLVKNQDPQTKIQLICDHRAQFGIYQTIKSAAENAGFDEMDLLLKAAKKK